MPRKSKSRLTSRKGRDSNGRERRRSHIVRSEIPTTVVESTVAETISEPLSTLPPATPTLQAAGPSKRQTCSAKRPRLSTTGNF